MFWPVKRVRVSDKERKLLVDNGRFVRILEPGVHWLPALGHNYSTEAFDITKPQFVSDWVDVLVNEHPATVERHFALVETRDTEVAIVYAAGKMLAVVGPGRRALYWNQPSAITAELFDAAVSPEVPPAKVPALVRLAPNACVTYAMVEEGKTGLLFIDNRFTREIGPGLHAFWSAGPTVRVDAIDRRWLPLEIPGQEILTKDKVSIRVNVSVQYRVADPLTARQAVKDFSDHLYRSVQFAVRQSLGKKTLDEILAEKVDLDAALVEVVRQSMASIGLEVGVIALKDIVLPGEVRDILNQVVAAEKQAQANLIRRREETAATRSLLNTAKLMEGNPLLIRLKELETLEKLTGKVERITVTGGFDGLLTQLLDGQTEPRP